MVHGKLFDRNTRVHQSVPEAEIKEYIQQKKNDGPADLHTFVSCLPLPLISHRDLHQHAELEASNIHKADHSGRAV
jgi:hypothetical protein